MENKEKISVVIPVYNVEKYIYECLDSVINQTYKNLEIILVDDGSPDNCPAICDEYAKKDGRIKVIHKENGGLSDARNAGIKSSTGKYIGFVDSDDYLEKNMFEELLKSLTENGSDLAICGVKKFDRESNKEFYGNRCLTQKEFMKALLCENVKSYTWNKLYKKELFEGIVFPVGELFEDMRILHLIGEKVSKASFTDFTFYNYRIRENSITATNKGEKATAYLKATENRCERYKNTELYTYAVTGEFKCIRVIVSDMSYSCEDKKMYFDLFNRSKKLFKICKNNIKGFQRLITYLYFVSPRLYLFCKNVFVKRK